MNSTQIPSTTIYLFQKWAYKVEKNWYGFDLEGVPLTWATKIDKFLNWVESNDSDFKIHQIKLKFGGLRVYLKLTNADESFIREYNARLGVLLSKCFDEKLIY